MDEEEVASDKSDELEPFLGEPEDVELKNQKISIYLLFMTVILLGGSFQFGFCIGELNAAEIFIPVFATSVKNSTIISHMGNSTKVCRNMLSWFKDCIVMSETQWDLCVSIFAIGGLIGAFSGGPLAKFIGRKFGLWSSTFLFLISYAMKVLFSNFWPFFFGRLFSGFASGIATSIVPMFLSEIAPKKYRGGFGVMHQFTLTFGIAVGAIISIFTFNGQWWRLMLGWVAIIPIIQMFVLPFVAYSPKFLVDKGRIEKAQRAMQKLRNSVDVEDELKLLLDEVKGQKKETSYQEEDSEPYAMPLGRTVLHFIVAMSLNMIQQVSGINAVVFYSTKVFESIFPGISAILTAVAMFINFISVAPAIWIVDFFGRKWALLMGVVFQFLSMCLITVALSISTFGYPDNEKVVLAMGIITIIAVFIFLVAFENSTGPIPWFYTSEIFLTKFRPWVSGVATAVNWLFVFTVGMLFPVFQRYMGPLSFLPFAAAMFLSIFFVFFFVMETKNRTIRQVAETPYWRFLLWCERFDAKEKQMRIQRNRLEKSKE